MLRVATYFFIHGVDHSTLKGRDLDHLKKSWASIFVQEKNSAHNHGQKQGREVRLPVPAEWYKHRNNIMYEHAMRKTLPVHERVWEI